MVKDVKDPVVLNVLFIYVFREWFGESGEGQKSYKHRYFAGKHLFDHSNKQLSSGFFMYMLAVYLRLLNHVLCLICDFEFDFYLACLKLAICPYVRIYAATSLH